MSTLLEIIERPCCPRCGNRLILRKNSKDGNHFWGCVEWPDCEYTANSLDDVEMDANYSDEDNWFHGNRW